MNFVFIFFIFFPLIFFLLISKISLDIKEIGVFSSVFYFSPYNFVVFFQTYKRRLFKQSFILLFSVLYLEQILKGLPHSKITKVFPFFYPFVLLFYI